MTKILSSALLFAVIFATTAMSTAEEVRFTLNRLYELDQDKYDDPLVVRAVLLAGNMVEDATPADALPLLAARSATVAREFLAAGMNPDLRTPTGETALFFAKDTATARVLIEAGADVNAQNRGCMTPLLLAANGDITELLLAAGAEVKPEKRSWKMLSETGFTSPLIYQTPLYYAPDAKAVRLLLAAGLDADETPKQVGQTPLCWARNAGVTRALLAAGANPCFKTREGVTPLHFAPDGESVRRLLEAGADPCAKSERGFTPLHEVRDAQSATLLIAAGADVNAATAYCTNEEFHANPHLKSPKEWLTPLAVALNDPSSGIIGERLVISSTAYTRASDGEISWNSFRYGTLPKETALEIARVLVAAGAKPDLPDDRGRTLLMKTPDVDFLKLLIHAGADVNARDEDGLTPLMHAADEACAEVLLVAGADVKLRDKEGRSAMAYARSAAWVKLLMAAGLSPLEEWENPLFHVWDVETAAMYLAMLRDAGRDGKTLLARRNAKGRTPLVEAFCKTDPKKHYHTWFDDTAVALEASELVLYSEHGYPLYDEMIDAAEYTRQEKKRCLLELLRLFVPAGADVNAADENGQTVLFHARFPEMVQLLLDAGARVDVADNDGATPLFNIWYGESVKLLLDAGADVNARDKNGWTRLHIAFSSETAEVLLAAGADVNARDKNGKTPLHEVSDWEVVKMFIAAGADVNARDNGGQTPLFRKWNPLVIRTLIAAGADVNARDNDQKTPLFYAYDISTAQTLLAAGADLHARDKGDKTVIDSEGWDPGLKQFYHDAGLRPSPHHTSFWGIEGVAYSEFDAEDFEDECGETYAITAMPARAEEVRFTLMGIYDEWVTFDDPLVVQAVLLAGDFVGEDDDSRTVASVLGRAGTPEVARIMLAAGADVNGGDDPPILHAVSGDVLEVFLEAGANVNPESIPNVELYGATPLCYAPDVKAVRLLLAAGVPVDVCVEKKPLTPLCCAKNAEITRALLAAGANPRFRTKDDFTPLHFAPDAESVRLLLEAGADVNAKSATGLTPLHDPADAACARALIAAGADVNALAAPKILYGFASSAHWMTPLAAVFTTDSFNSRHCRRMLPPRLHNRKIYFPATDRSEIARVLLEAGADASMKNADEKTLLWWTPYPELMPLLLERGVDVNMRDEFGNTPIKLADEPEMTAKLIAAGADVNVRDNEGCTPLMAAGYPEIVAQLLAAGADVHAKDDDGMTALDHAWDVPTIKILIAAGADPLVLWENPLFHARDAETFLLYLKMLRDAGRDVKACLNEQDEDGNTPLMTMLGPQFSPVNDYVRDLDFQRDITIWGEDGIDPEEAESIRHEMTDNDMLPLQRTVIAAGADVRLKNADGRTPLFYARKPETVTLLLEIGLRADDVDAEGLTPLHVMMRNGVPVKMVEIMLADGADADARDAEGMTPLLNLAMCGNPLFQDIPALTRVLLDAGANPDARPNRVENDDWEGGGASGPNYPEWYTALHWMKDPDAARMLIAAGANINARTEKEQTPLHTHVYTHPHAAVESVAVIRVLLEAGANVNARDHRGQTPLHYARTARYARLLIAAGADVNARDEYGQTPLFEVRNPTLAKTLIVAGADVDARDKRGRTPLMNLWKDDLDVAKTLIAAGADVNARDKDGQTVYSLTHSPAFRALLLKAGAEPREAVDTGEEDDEDENEDFEEFDAEDFYDEDFNAEDFE